MDGEGAEESHFVIREAISLCLEAEAEEAGARNVAPLQQKAPHSGGLWKQGQPQPRPGPTAHLLSVNSASITSSLEAAPLPLPLDPLPPGAPSGAPVAPPCWYTAAPAA